MLTIMSAPENVSANAWTCGSSGGTSRVVLFRTIAPPRGAELAKRSWDLITVRMPVDFDVVKDIVTSSRPGFRWRRRRETRVSVSEELAWWRKPSRSVSTIIYTVYILFNTTRVGQRVSWPKPSRGSVLLVSKRIHVVPNVSLNTHRVF